ncbi:MAG: cyclic nucleotide-binding domain-containing protein [Vicingus serpentipes]|nr:cyclic nucleotide-binding domain-containing protein [Vicingus serpentipes]
MNNIKSKLNKSILKDLIEEIKSSSRVFTIEKGDYLFTENSPLEFVYLIDEGEVALLKLNKNNDSIELMNQQGGDIVGVDILFKNSLCDYSAVAKKSCKLYRTSLEKFQHILSHQKETSMELMRYLCSLLNQLESKI